MKPLRVLLVDCDSVRAAERRKAERLAALEGTEVHLLVSRAYTLAGKALRLEPAPSAGCRTTVGTLVGHPPARTLFATGLARALRERPDVVHVTADENFFLTAGVLRARGIRGRIAHIPWGTDVERVGSGDRAAGRRRFGLSGFVVGYRGRLVEEKGLADLARACEHLGGETTLAIAGDGPLRGALAARAAGGVDASARAAPGARRVRLLGNLADRDVPDFLAAIDVLALSSRSTPVWKEQFGRALGDALARLAGDAALRERLGRAARERARNEFSWDTFAGRTAAFFRSLRGEPVADGSFEEMP